MALEELNDYTTLSLRQYQPSLQESMATMANIIPKLEALIAKLLATSVSTASHSDSISKHLPVTTNHFTPITESLSALVSGRPETELNNTENLPPLPPPQPHAIKDTTYTPPMLQPIIQHDMVTFHSTTLHQNYGLDMLVKDMLPIFCRVKTFFVGHQCHPPKFVFLQAEPEPPWKPHATRDNMRKPTFQHDKTTCHDCTICYETSGMASTVANKSVLEDKDILEKWGMIHANLLES